MAKLLALSLLVGALADAGLRGRAQRDPSFDNLFGKADSSSDNADPMDLYIKSSKPSSDSSVWWSKSDTTKERPSSVFTHSEESILDHSSAASSFEPSSYSSIFDHASASSVMDNLFKHTSNAITGHASESAPVFKPSRSSWADDKDMFPKQDMFPKPMAKKQAPVAMPRTAGGSSSESNGEGAVIDIKLDSELQEEQSLIQIHGKAASNSAPDVEAAVTSQRLQDVYIHDQFSEAAAADVKQEQEVNANHDLKAAV